jgi:Fic family protein
MKIKSSYLSLIVSFDIIVKPPYEITPKILNLIGSISEMIGEVNANYLSKQSPQLRKQNRIKTIQSSLQIEGNTLTEDQVTSLIENKRIIGPEKDVLEVLNAIKTYELLKTYKSHSVKDFLKAHATLMDNLITTPGKFRTQGVGIVNGKEIKHLAPPFENVPYLMNNLFAYLKDEREHPLIKSCVFHYEMEFIHPFIDGNGRMGRLWHTVILSQKHQIFEFLPFETLINANQSEYYKSLSMSDKLGKSTPFIEYMLEVIEKSLSQLLNYNNRTLKETDRLEYFLNLGRKEFSRKDYMNIFKDISSATASRDLKKAIALNLVTAVGDKNQTKYQINIPPNFLDSPI